MNLRRLHLDFHRCTADLNVPSRITAAMQAGIAASGASLRNEVVEQFTPHGTTVVAILAESHYVVSTWPEHDFVSVDVSVCGDVDLAALTLPLRQLLGAQSVKEQMDSTSVGVDTESVGVNNSNASSTITVVATNARVTSTLAASEI